jgi:GTP-binding protein HflX
MSRAASETRKPAERTIVAALVLPDSDEAMIRDPLAEISGLAEAAGGEVVGGLFQKLVSVNARAAFGKGKIAEIGELAKAEDATVVVIDFDLSPSQGRNLEKDIGVRVVDRTELILDIFASRAQSRQAKMQVELAQLEYLRTRLRRMWTHLERMEGAIGARGPGETQLESDRRLIGNRIVDLKRRLKEIERRRHREAVARVHPHTISLVGYTNAGKSSLLQQLTGAGVYIADQLFATLDTRVRTWSMEDKRKVVLTDTVGFVRDLPHHLVASFHATLEETLNADLLLHVVDASAPDRASHLRAVDTVLNALDADDIPQIIVLNKADRLQADERLLLEHEFPDAVLISVHSGEGLSELDRVVGAWLDRWSLHIEVEVPVTAGRLLSDLRASALVEEECYVDETWRARLTLSPRQWNSLRGEVESVGGAYRSCTVER